MLYKINNINFYSMVTGDLVELPVINRKLGIHNRDNKFVISDIKTGTKIIEEYTKEETI